MRRASPPAKGPLPDWSVFVWAQPCSGGKWHGYFRESVILERLSLCGIVPAPAHGRDHIRAAPPREVLICELCKRKAETWARARGLR